VTVLSLNKLFQTRYTVFTGERWNKVTTEKKYIYQIWAECDDAHL
jgi:hypothetical protein